MQNLYNLSSESLSMATFQYKNALLHKQKHFLGYLLAIAFVFPLLVLGNYMPDFTCWEENIAAKKKNLRITLLNKTPKTGDSLMWNLSNVFSVACLHFGTLNQ